MKNLIFFILLPMAVAAQVQIDKPLELTGSGLDARVMGIDTAVLPGDAVPLKMLKKKEPIYIGSITGDDINAAPNNASITFILPVSIDSGYVIEAIQLRVTKSFNSINAYPIIDMPSTTTAGIIPYTIGLHSANGVDGLMAEDGRIWSIPARYDLPSNCYFDGLKFVFGFSGAANNPQNYNKDAELRIALVLRQVKEF